VKPSIGKPTLAAPGVLDEQLSIPRLAERWRLRVQRLEDGDPAIVGKYGHVHAHGDGRFGLLFMPGKVRLWAYAKRRLEAGGLLIWQDGDEEGSALFDPGNPAQARVALKVVGVRRRRRAGGRPLTSDRARHLAQILWSKRAQSHVAGQEAMISPGVGVGVGS
jgi:hypothetical protein